MSDLIAYLENLPPCHEVDYTVVRLPAAWGEPPGAPYSEERAAWIRQRVTEQLDRTEAESRGGREEVANGGRFGSFPAEWGIPPGGPLSDERAAWVRDNVRKRMTAAPLSELQRQVIRLRNQARLDRLRERQQQW
ncbi:MAG TPA: hypothetical protein VFP89_02335 [Propionibacteriaceae bacterium]|nr:hypothetical protein [Propionibacteriaceae bacterium]